MIETAGLTKRFGDTLAVDELTLRIEAGEVVGFLGPNGSGKTTTIRLLMGLLRPSAGRASMFGRDCHADAVALKRDVGYLPDEPFLYPYLTGLETLELVAGLHGIAPADARRRAGEIAERLGLGAAARAYTVTYSLGMKKRLALALALVHEPRVLILDEPTNGLDPAGARQMRATIAEYAAGGRTIFLSTHLLDAAERLCHRVAIIQKGRLQAVGTPDELRARFAAAPGTTLEDLFLRVTRGAGAARGDGARFPIGAGPLARLLIRARLRSFRNGLRARGSRRIPVLVTIAGLWSSPSPTSACSRRPSQIVASVGLAGQTAALALVTGALAFGSLTAKAASSDAVRAGSAENEFLLARPVSLAALVAARGIADAVTDPVGALFLFPVLLGAALVWRLPPAAWLLAAAISVGRPGHHLDAGLRDAAHGRARRRSGPAADGLDGIAPGRGAGAGCSLDGRDLGPARAGGARRRSCRTSTGGRTSAPGSSDCGAARRRRSGAT